MCMLIKLIYMKYLIPFLPNISPHEVQSYILIPTKKLVRLWIGTRFMAHLWSQLMILQGGSLKGL
jgi:hypothetical protein